MNKIYVAIGANMGDRKANITRAIELLKEKINDIQLAPIYETKAFGVTNQPNFYNTALAGKTELMPEELLKFVKEVEKRVGRVARYRWGPREIDVDIIFYNGLILKSEQLTIPHPGITERFFVLKPLSDLAPNLVHPVLHKSISELLSQLPKEPIKLI